MFNQLEAVETLRMDSEYFAKDYLKIEQFIKRNVARFSKIADFGIAVDGSAFYPALEPHYDTGDFPFLRVGDVKRYVDFDGCIKIPRGVLPGYPTLKSVFPGDIVLTKGGTVAKAGYIEQESCVSRDLIFLNSSALPEEESISLYLYLATDFAYKQLVRSASQSVQPHLTITLVRNLDVFALNDTFKRLAVEKYKQARDMMAEAKALYRQAEADLLHHLGLPAQPPQPVLHEVAYNVKNLDQSVVASRWDAEFYQPKYDDQEATVRANNTDVRLIAHMERYNARGLQPEYIPDGKIHVVNSRHILETGLDYSGFEKTTEDFWQRQEKGRIKRNDILIYTTGANIGRTQVYLQDEKALASNHVNILRLAEGINPRYVAFVMNSRVGRLQTEQLSAGSAQQELYPKDVSQFYIPFVSPELQEALVQKITEAHELEKESEALLSRAKQAVEVAIEQGEAAGLRFLGSAA